MEQGQPKLFQQDKFFLNVWDDEYSRSATDDTGNMSDNDMETKTDKSKKKRRKEWNGTTYGPERPFTSYNQSREFTLNNLWLK